MEENNYYPFGLKHKGYNQGTSPLGNDVAQKWKYNGVELDETTGLYEMPLRGYDPAIGRFNRVDPVVHYSLSTYQGFDNNPVFWADPSGANSVTNLLGRNYGADGLTNDQWLDLSRGGGGVSSSAAKNVAKGNMADLSRVGQMEADAAANPISVGTVEPGEGDFITPFTTHMLFAQAAAAGVTSKQEAGLAFERAALDFFLLFSNQNKTFESKRRKALTGGKFGAVKPDAVTSTKVVTLFGTTVLPNSFFHEVKAVSGTISLKSGSSDYQVLGLIDAAANSTPGGKQGRAIVNFYTTANTIIDPSVVAYATRLNVTVRQSIAFQMSNGNLYFSPAVTLSPNIPRQKVHAPIGMPGPSSVPLRFD
ncbi:RHS repeat-associated core domain-containing protein [Flagellimonas meishanensis]|uniref:RHS repeat-associated core domain-containing protein n=1 Tax=Flagellimonas meishanensis TaxID=2873264 RepID=UPI001CA62E9F|nr:RHS repeat-associated core domain-containing protein [[Muricauda] meishanensis]